MNMMGYFGSWMMHHSWNGLKGHDGKVKFEGFGRIFGKESNDECLLANANNLLIRLHYSMSISPKMEI